MSVKMRQLVEREIATAVVDVLLTAGFNISVDNGDNDGHEYQLGYSTNRADILNAMFLTDDERLYVGRDGETIGWVYLVYGNDGWDVISDYTVNLESLIGEGTTVDKVIKKYED